MLERKNINGIVVQEIAALLDNQNASERQHCKKHTVKQYGWGEGDWVEAAAQHTRTTNKPLFPFCMCENYRKCVYSSGHQALSSRLQTPHPAFRKHAPCACAVKRSRSTPASLQCRRVGQKTWNRNLIQRPATYRAVLATNTHKHTHTHTHTDVMIYRHLYTRGGATHIDQICPTEATIWPLCETYKSVFYSFFFKIFNYYVLSWDGTLEYASSSSNLFHLFLRLAAQQQYTAVQL